MSNINAHETLFIMNIKEKSKEKTWKRIHDKINIIVFDDAVLINELINYKIHEYILWRDESKKLTMCVSENNTFIKYQCSDDDLTFENLNVTVTDKKTSIRMEFFECPLFLIYVYISCDENYKFLPQCSVTAREYVDTEFSF
jgi:hypothetical protein